MQRVLALDNSLAALAPRVVLPLIVHPAARRGMALQRHAAIAPARRGEVRAVAVLIIPVVPLALAEEGFEGGQASDDDGCGGCLLISASGEGRKARKGAVRTDGGFQNAPESEEDGVGASCGGDLHGADDGEDDDDETDAEDTGETQLLAGGNLHFPEQTERHGHDCGSRQYPLERQGDGGTYS